MTNIVRFIGDIHGNLNQYMNIVTESPYPTVQVGDFGFGFINVNPIPVDRYNEHRFIRGNHDCPEICYRQGNFIADGTIEGNVGYVGGADSIDKAYRTEGISWWSDEQLSVAKLNDVLDLFVAKKPELIVSHECPEFVAEAICQHFRKIRYVDDNRTRMMLEQIYYHYTPKLHIFGHWHHNFDWVNRGTRFICLNELSYIDVDLDNLDNYDNQIVSYYKGYMG